VRCPECRTDNEEGSRFCRNCATPLPRESSQGNQQGTSTLAISPPREDLTPGTEFAGRYQVIEEIGRGGMGRVYKVLDKEINEKVSLKLIRPEVAVGKETLERFQNEIKIARRITHKNVCRVYHFSKHNNTHYITMEFVSGENLKKMIRMSKEMSLEAVLSIARQVCEGLAEAHRLGIVHRDLKPQNIMIDEEGTAKVMDFGIASSLETQGTTRPGVMIGTPEYISPEQVEGGTVDARSDLYSVGIILYEMLTGRTPFAGQTPWSLAYKQQSERPRDPRDINPEIPESLSRVILKCLEKKKEERYQSAEELQSDLKKVEEEHVRTETRLRSGLTPSPRIPFFPFNMRKAVAWGLVTIFLVAFGALTLTLGKRIFRRPGPAAAADRVKMAVITFENQTGDSAYDYLRDAIPNLLITSLEQSKLIRVTSWERLRDLLKQLGKGDQQVIDRELGFELCRQDEVQAIVLGTYTKAGDTFATDAKVLDVRTKGILKTVSSRGDGVDSILKRQIDELSAEIAKGLVQPEDVTRVSASPIAEVTTNSLEAYNFFLRGRDDYEKFYLTDAQRSLERAVELDPEFAMAHYYLARVHLQLGNSDAARRSLAKLKELADKVSGKEGLYIQALLAGTGKFDEEKYLGTLRKIVADYPEEKRARMDLGTYFYRAGKFRAAVDELRRAFQLDPKYGFAMNMLAYTYTQLKEYDEAVKWFKEYASVSPGDANPYDSLGDLYFNIGKFDEALEKFREAVRIKPDFGSGYKVSYVFALRGDYGQAMTWIDQHIANAPSNAARSWGYNLKAIYYHMMGKVGLAFQTLDEAQKSAELENALTTVDSTYRSKLWIAWDWDKYELFLKSAKERYDYRSAKKIQSEDRNAFIYGYYQGLFDLKESRPAAAKAKLAELDAIRSEKLTPLDIEVLDSGLEHFRAEIALADGRADDALVAYGKIQRTPIVIVEPYILVQRNLPYVYDIPGRISLMKGKTAQAISHYERLVSPDPRQRELEILHPFSRLELARLYEATGNISKAIAQYEQLTEIWKDADPGLVKVGEARRRLAALRARS
jgi:tetratricopeptide (TPR) repeat protein/predicted Ser/Thr protein kinase